MEGNKATNPDRTRETILTLQFIGYKLQTNGLILQEIYTTTAMMHALLRVGSFDTTHTIDCLCFIYKMRFSCKKYSLVRMIYCLFRTQPYIAYTEILKLTKKHGAF